MSSLNQVIPPSPNDPLRALILSLAKNPAIKTILEIGSAGTGATAAFVQGIRQNPSHPHLYCMEISQPLFQSLANRYAADSFVHPLRASSVPLSTFPSDQQLSDFYNSIPTALNKSPLPELLSQLHADIDYLQSENIPTNGIALIKKNHNIPFFDLVLIDGSEFTGPAELPEVYGSKYILLDDVSGYKNHHNFHRLSHDPNYALRQHDLSLRNGFALFERICPAPDPMLDFNIPQKLFLQNAIGPAMTALDLSYDPGDSSIMLSALVGPAGKVLSLRPSQAAADQLQANATAANISNLTAHASRLCLTPSENPADTLNLESFLRSQNIPYLDFLRLDAPTSHAQLTLLLSAKNLLATAAIQLLQFSFPTPHNHSITTPEPLTPADAFSLLASHRYRIHLLTPQSKIGPETKSSTALHETFLALSPNYIPTPDLLDSLLTAKTPKLTIESKSPTGSYNISFN